MEPEPPMSEPEPAVMLELARFEFETTPTPEMPAKLMLPDRESEVPWALVKEKFWREEEAVVLVAKILEAPINGDSIPPEKVEVAVDVEVMEPVVRRPEVMLEKTELIERKMDVKREVEVALAVKSEDE